MQPELVALDELIKKLKGQIERLEVENTKLKVFQVENVRLKREIDSLKARLDGKEISTNGDEHTQSQEVEDLTSKELIVVDPTEIPLRVLFRRKIFYFAYEDGNPLPPEKQKVFGHIYTALRALRLLELNLGKLSDLENVDYTLFVDAKSLHRRCKNIGKKGIAVLYLVCEHYGIKVNWNLTSSDMEVVEKMRKQLHFVKEPIKYLITTESLSMPLEKVFNDYRCFIDERGIHKSHSSSASISYVYHRLIEHEVKTLKDLFEFATDLIINRRDNKPWGIGDSSVVIIFLIAEHFGLELDSMLLTDYEEDIAEMRKLFRFV